MALRAHSTALRFTDADWGGIEHSKSQDAVWFYGTILAAPIFVLLAGLFYVGRRRRRFVTPRKRSRAAPAKKTKDVAKDEEGEA